MKKLLPFFYFIFLFVDSNAQIQDIAEKNSRFSFCASVPNNAADIAAAKIRTEKVFVFSPTKADSVLTAVYQYNENGQVFSSILYKEKKQIHTQYSYTFYPSGIVASQKTVVQQSNTDRYIKEIIYHENGLEAFCYMYNNDSSNGIIMKKEYNTEGICTHIKYLNTDSVFESLREYDIENGEITAAKQFLGSNNYIQLVFKNISVADEQLYRNGEKIAGYMYDNAGRCIKEYKQVFLPRSGVSINDVSINVSSNNYRNQFYQGGSSLSVPSIEQSNIYLTTLLFGNVYGDNAEEILSPGNVNLEITTTPSVERLCRYETQTLQHQYNSNGTLYQTIIVISGIDVAVVKHIYETK